MQVIDLFPLWAALHTGGGPLDLEIRGCAGFCLDRGCFRVPSAGMVSRRSANGFGPPCFWDFGN
jgi:hypothetical protein